MLNAIDITLAVLILFGMIRGFMKGFIYELAMLGALLVCYFLGFKLAGIVAGFLSKHFHANPEHLRYISYFIVWLGVSIAAWFIAKLLSGLADIVALGPFNKVAGAIFGGMKYALVISLLLFFINKTNILTHDQRASSRMYYPLLKISSTVMPFIIS